MRRPVELTQSALSPAGRNRAWDLYSKAQVESRILDLKNEVSELR